MAIISIASWAVTDTNIQLKINWQQLGIDENKATITASFIKDFQAEKSFNKDESILIEKK